MIWFLEFQSKFKRHYKQKIDQAHLLKAFMNVAFQEQAKFGPILKALTTFVAKAMIGRNQDSK